MSDKFIGFHRLIEACDEAGCPACRCLDADTHRYLTAFLYEHVTDPVSRSRLRASWGLCNWHAWMLRATADPASGVVSMSLVVPFLVLAAVGLVPWWLLARRASPLLTRSGGPV